jgi:hypothetical protein
MPRHRRAFSTAKKKPRERTECNRSDLSERTAGYDEGNCRQRNPGAARSGVSVRVMPQIACATTQRRASTRAGVLQPQGW